METLEHEGITYVKVSALAKKYKYTTDYIGQLCRAGKVECQLVGRAWFVREDSLVDHKSDRYKQINQTEPLSKIKVFSDDRDVEKTVVYPTLSKHAHKNFESRSGSLQSNSLHHQSNYVSPAYLSDDTSTHLSINVHSDAPAHDTYLSKSRLVDDKVERIKVTSAAKKPTRLTFSPLPEVTLRGSLSVKSLDTEEKYVPSEPVVHTDFPKEVEEERFMQSNQRVFVEPRPQRSSATQFSTPAVMRTSSTLVTTTSPADTSSLLSSLFLPMVIVGSAACVFCILSLSSIVVSDGLVLRQSWKFNVSQAITAVSFLFEKTP